MGIFSFIFASMNVLCTFMLAKIKLKILALLFYFPCTVVIENILALQLSFSIRKICNENMLKSIFSMSLLMKINLLSTNLQKFYFLL